jgi:TRAP-type transport system periplasmic protein
MKIKSTLIYTLLVLVLALSVLLGACGQGTTATVTTTKTVTATGTTPATTAPDVIQLKCATHFGAPAAQSKALEQFCKDVTEQTGGKIKIDFYAGGTLLDAAAMYQGVVDRVADLGYDPIHYTAGRFPVTEVITSTLGWPSAWVGAHVANEFYYKYEAAQAEWKDVKVLWLQANEPKVIYTKTPVRTLEDLKGKILRAAGSAGDIISALGGTPAATSTSTMADDIKKGTLDGAFLPYETIKTFKCAEVIKYITACWDIGSTDCFFFIMNKDAYASLSALPEAKAVFDRLVGQYFEYFGGLVWNQIDYPGLAEAQKYGAEVIELSAAESARWEAAAAPAVEKYKTTMVGKGYTAAEVQGWIDFIKERISYWSAKQIELNILSLTGPEDMRK